MRTSIGYKWLGVWSVGAIVFAMSLANVAGAQRNANQATGSKTIAAGTSITVVTSEAINVKDSDGRTYVGSVQENVLSRNGSVGIPRGSRVELVVKRISDDEVALDLDSVVIGGERYSLETEDAVLDAQDRDGIGANERTGKYIGGGALLGAVIGAIAGGGKGAAIGAGAGAGVGAGTQILTRGRNINVPVESLLTFRLDKPLRAGVVNQNQGNNSEAYREGLRAGRSDSDRNLPRNVRSRWTNGQDRRDYEAGYDRGYVVQGASTARAPATDNRAATGGTVSVGANKIVTWRGPARSSVYVQTDSNPQQLFSGASSGSEAAPWISSGHVYVFILKDGNAKEIAREEVDLRPSPRGGARSRN